MSFNYSLDGLGGLYSIHQNVANDEERAAFLKMKSFHVHNVYTVDIYIYIFIFTLIVNVQKEFLCSLAPQHCNHLTQ